VPRTSAGILLYRVADGGVVDVLLGHMGGPYWARKDAAAWSIPKGEYGEGEDPFAVAQREFLEELGAPVPSTEFLPLGQLRQSTAKTLTVWAARGDFDVTTAVSNTFELEWPPRSGRRLQFPEVDRAEWFSVAQAREKLIPAQVPLLDRLP
jgi:predicted NUDIX family NTP pyrophosphohydrolase